MKNLARRIPKIAQFTEGQRARRIGDSVIHDENGDYVATFALSGTLEFVPYAEYQLLIDFNHQKAAESRKYLGLMESMKADYLEKLAALRIASNKNSTAEGVTSDEH